MPYNLRMPKPQPVPLSDVFERYALGLAAKRSLPLHKDPKAARHRAALLDELRRLGVQGWPERMTLYTRSLPEGCRPCLKGRASNLVMTLLCNRECFFCFNPKPRTDTMSVHGKDVRSHKEAARLLKSLGIRSVGISGGEPLLKPARLFALVKELRRPPGPRLRIDLYTNGVLLTPELLKKLKAVGVDALRLNLAADNYDLKPVKLAQTVFNQVEVEIPAVPEHKAKLLRLMEDLDRLKVHHLILHELFASAHNAESLMRQGRLAKNEQAAKTLTWSAVAGSEELVLELLAAALRRKQKLSLYYCSCATQAWIAEQALKGVVRKGTVWTCDR